MSRISFIGLIVFFLAAACSNPPSNHQKPANQSPVETTNLDGMDQTSINQNSYDKVQFWKQKMNQRLDHIKQLYELKDWRSPKHRERFFTNLDASQKAFETYIKAQVELEYPTQEEDEWWGSGVPPCINSIYEAYYKMRYQELELWEKGIPDGEMCGGLAMTQFELEEILKKK